jgi:hypothetical protein
VPPNKGMKLTSAEHIERSQLITGVLPTVAGAARGSSPGRTRRGVLLSPTEWLPRRLSS